MKINKFAFDVGKIMSGVILINVITVVSIPLITRMYGPDLFGKYQQFLALILILSSISTLKYEMAVVLPRNRISAESIVKLAFYVLVIVSLFFLFLSFIFRNAISAYVHLPQYVSYLLPVLIFLTAVKPVFQYWYTRNQRYGMLSSNNVAEQVISRGGMILAGSVFPSASMLILAYGASKFFTTINLVRASRIKLHRAKKKLLLYYSRQYKKFLVYMTPATLANTASIQAPILLIGYFFGPTAAGLYAIVQKLIEMPLKIVQQSLGQVYFERAAKEIHAKGHATSITIKMVLFLGCISLISVAILYFFGKPALTFFLGSKWNKSASYLILLLPALFFRFIKAPVNYWVLIGKQEITLMMNCLQLAMTTISFLLFHKDPAQSVFSFSLFTAVFYLFNIVCVVIHSQKMKQVQSN